MATFEKGAKTSIKGTQITLSGLIVESSKSRVIFKSSRNDKVICELVSPISSGDAGAGTSLTVVGKVRGRGLLGNVTLDGCHPVSTPPVIASPSTIALEEPPAVDLPSTTPEAVVEEPSVNKDAPAVTSTPVKVAPKPSPRVGLMVTPELVTSVPNDPEPSQEPEPSIKTIESSEAGARQVLVSSKPTLPQNPYAIGAVLVGLALLAAVMLRAAFRDRFGVYSHAANTAEARRLALETLLSSEKKKK